MDKYEELLQEAADCGVNVIENYDLSSTHFKGIYCDGTVALDNRIYTTLERKCVLAEELGHHYTAVGDITDLSSASNRKQELHGRILAYDRIIGLCGIVRCYQSYCRNRYEMAELLDVTEDFLQEALDYYSDKYGDHAVIDNYVIYFHPTLTVLELI